MRKMKFDKNDWMWLWWQILAWIILLFIPSLLDFICNFNAAEAALVLKYNLMFATPMEAFYMANFYFFIPRFLHNNKAPRFWLINALLIALANIGCFFIYFDFKQWDYREVFYYMTIFSVTLMYLFILGFAIGMRYIKRSQEMKLLLEEEQKRNAEAELVWLKNQLNPHFLFNTLNNISSLVRVDADVAQDSIGQLSDLLRYTLYESNKPLVPVDGEIEFMENYIDLMKLRCNDLAKIETDMRVPVKPLKVVPLLFICLIENAFKHGVNSRLPSFVIINMTAEGNDLIFQCENSVHPKSNVDRSGSGIGLENLRRRLELTYPERYEYKQESDDTTYSVKIRLKDCV